MEAMVARVRWVGWFNMLILKEVNKDGIAWCGVGHQDGGGRSTIRQRFFGRQMVVTTNWAMGVGQGSLIDYRRRRLR